MCFLLMVLILLVISNSSTQVNWGKSHLHLLSPFLQKIHTLFFCLPIFHTDFLTEKVVQLQKSPLWMGKSHYELWKCTQNTNIFKPKGKKKRDPIFTTKIYINKNKITPFKHGCGQIVLPYFFLTNEGEKHALELLIKHGRWSNSNQSKPNLGKSWRQLSCYSPKAR